jgi:hypothetical protein
MIFSKVFKAQSDLSTEEAPMLEQKVFKAFNLFRQKMADHGRTVSFSTHINPQKTYSWRFVSNFVRKMEENGIDETMLPMAVEAVVSNAKRQGTLSRGFAILNHGDLLEICEKKLISDVKEDGHTLAAILNSYEFLMRQLHGRSMREVLLERLEGNFARITCWYEQKLLSVGYIALSRACRYALRRLPLRERNLFPNTYELLKLRLKLVHNEMLHKLQIALGSDLFED